MTKAEYLIHLVEKLNTGEKVIAGGAAAVGAGLLGAHLAQKYGIDIHHHLANAKDTVKGVGQAISDKVHGTETTRTSSSSPSHVETPETRHTRIEKHYDASGNVRGETHHSTLPDGTRVEKHRGETPYRDKLLSLGPEHSKLKNF